MVTPGKRRRRREARERIEQAAIDRTGYVDEWFALLPHDALLVVKENGVVIDKLRKFQVNWRGSADLYLFLRDDAEFGYGKYTIAASYNGAFRGEHLRVEVGEPKQWRRGQTRAETRAFVEAERVKRERTEHYQRDPLGAVATLLEEYGVLPGADRTETSVKRGRIPEEQLRTMAQTLRDAGPEEFRRCCEYLREELPPELLEEVFSEYRRLETSRS
jgi:hypothetical protein